MTEREEFRRMLNTCEEMGRRRGLMEAAEYLLQWAIDNAASLPEQAIVVKDRAKVLAERARNVTVEPLPAPKPR